MQELDLRLLLAHEKLHVIEQEDVQRSEPIPELPRVSVLNARRELVEELLGLGFLGEAANVVLMGPNGVGKTTIARNIGYTALLGGYTVMSTPGYTTEYNISTVETTLFSTATNKRVWSTITETTETSVNKAIDSYIKVMGKTISESGLF